ncbi:ORF6N domain-containing protein [Xanthomonas oryzae]|uniref:ORF6N domain-containing protein n=1 Tax=Xanthomonas oryzae TaxID=347 RepID=UPI000C7D80C7|nr:ORF6N domain-containing protein [Xanthomonas oryzae]AUJ13400.1 hypothetical protein BVV20_16355 [Xanthomonas oryzae pv. oryzae]QBG87538.1 hypothetical protein EYC54_06970 [Xanthomonas oryzae]
MSTTITVNSVELVVLQYHGHRVITLAQVDAAHGRPPGTAKRNFSEHRARFVEGTDYLRVGANEFRTHLDPTHSKFASEDAILFTETGYTMLVKPFNDDLAWQVQRQIVSGYFAAARLLSGQHAPSPLAGYVGVGCTLIESISRTLNLAPSSTLGMYQKLGEKVGHTDLLPAYAIDGLGEGGSEPTAALQTLLKQHAASIGVVRAYAVLEALGIVERRNRPSHRGGTKQFWTITVSGARYGKNLTSPANPRHTQPHFYTEKFPALLQMMVGKIAA